MRVAVGRWLFLLVGLIGCSPAASRLVWVGHVADLRSPTGEQVVAALRERRKQEDAADLRIRHAEAGEGPRAAAVRLLSVNGVKALILGPGVADVEGVASAVRAYNVPVIVLDETAGPMDGAVLLGPDAAVRGRALADHARKGMKLERVKVRVEEKDAVCRAGAEAFRTRFGKPGGDKEEAVLLAVPPGDLARTIKEAGADTYLYAGPDRDPEAVARALPATGWKEVILVTERAENAAAAALDVLQGAERKASGLVLPDDPAKDVRRRVEVWRLTPGKQERVGP